MGLVRCQCCGKEYPTFFPWYICDTCGFRVCTNCLSKHRGPHGFGFKCSQCTTGQMQYKEG